MENFCYSGVIRRVDGRIKVVFRGSRDVGFAQVKRLNRAENPVVSLCRPGRLWIALQSQPRWRRWSVKSVLLALTVFLSLYPNPHLFCRHISHIREADRLLNPDDPAVRLLSERLDRSMSQYDGDVLAAVEALVHEEVPYGWDWDVWGVVDYLPSVGEVIARGQEDCDGRAVLAAAILRARGIDARLVGDFRHVWVRTPIGDTMNPLGDPVFDVKGEEVVFRYRRMLDLGPVGFGIAVFPLVRETIILLAAWTVVLPARIRWPMALTGLGVIFAGLFVVRSAGREPLDPCRWGIGLGLTLVLAGLIIGAVLSSGVCNNTDRTVCRIRDYT